MKKYVYFFGGKYTEGNGKMKRILGGKGANLAEMARIGIPVPFGFTISAEICPKFLKEKKIPKKVIFEIEKNLKKLEKISGKKFGDPKNPLLVSVRSGAEVSMPGMMDTVLNLGLNERTVLALFEKSKNLRFALDCYRRLISMFSNVVKKIEWAKFERELEKVKKEARVKNDIELKEEDLKKLIKRYKKIYQKEIGKDFPQDPKVQLYEAIEAVFKSWNTPRAVKYRKIHKIEGLLGTAVNIQEMVFGNFSKDSATGVAFTRNPATGENEFYGEYLLKAQGEDVVAGIRTPCQLTKKLSQKWAKENNISERERRLLYPSLEEKMPKIFKQLQRIRKILERHFKDVQDIEFTIEEGKLYILQTRVGKRTALADLKFAVDFVKEKIISEKEAISRIDPQKLSELLHRRVDPNEKIYLLGTGLPASPGAAVGEIVFFSDEAVDKEREGKRVILVRQETSPDDVEGMSVSEGILTAIGGMTSHAAIVARGMGIPAVVGCSNLKIDYKKRVCQFDKVKLKEGDFITIDGISGKVILGKAKLILPKMTKDLKKILLWADKIKRVGVRANAETISDIQKALEFGAEGIGLARTEHMFFKQKRLSLFQKMILAEDEKERKSALLKILPFQRNDFIKMFKVLKGKPIVIRLLDPPLHEFLPKTEKEIKILAKKLKITPKKIKEKIEDLKEINPMLGHRGCRLSVTFPEILKMQTRAIISAAIYCQEKKIRVSPEIMIPLVSIKEELENQIDFIKEEAEKVMREKRKKISFKIGTMIETPRACLIAKEIAPLVDFFSFGTNDLTQMTFGFSRDDSEKFLPLYIDLKILKEDPFLVLDEEGVGRLMAFCVKEAKEANPKLKIGICGEHGGDPQSVKFCHRLGLDYVSCSPFRIPLAKLSAAQINLL